MTIHFQKFRSRHPPPANQSQNKVKNLIINQNEQFTDN